MTYHEQYIKLCELYKNHPSFTIKPIWYHQSPIYRLRRVIERISFKKIISYKDIEKFRFKYSHPTWRAIENAFLLGVYINGRLRPHGWLSNQNGYHKIAIAIAIYNPDDYCYWCGKEIYIKNKRKEKYYAFDNVCKDKLCREMHSVMMGSHTEIKQIRGIEYGETFKNSFMVEFFVRKVKCLQKKLRSQDKYRSKLNG